MLSRPTIAHPPPPRARGRAGARSPRGAPRSLPRRAGPAPHSRTNNVRLGGTKAAGLGLLNTSEARRAARFIGLGEPRLQLRSLLHPRPRSAHGGEVAGVGSVAQVGAGEPRREKSRGAPTPGCERLREGSGRALWLKEVGGCN